MKRNPFADLHATRDAVKNAHAKALRIRDRLDLELKKADKLLDTKTWGESLHAKFRTEKLSEARKALQEIEAVISRGKAALTTAGRDVGKAAFLRSARFAPEPAESSDAMLIELRELREEMTRARWANELRDLQPKDLAALADEAAVTQSAALVSALQREHTRRWRGREYTVERDQHQVGTAVMRAEMSLDLPQDHKQAVEAVEEISRSLTHLEAVHRSIQTGDNRHAHDQDMIHLTREHGAENAVNIHREQEAARIRQANDAALHEATKALSEIFADDNEGAEAIH